MSKNELHDWEYAIEKLSGNNANKMLDIAQDIYNTAFVRGKNHMTWEQEHCEDCISRKFMYNLGATCIATRNKNGKLIALGTIENLPSVTPTHKIGYWKMTNDYLTTAYGSVDYVKCSCCGEDSLEEGDFCPNCGAKMEEVEE
jgi:hypothetical protein